MQVVGPSAPLAHVPLVEVRDLRGEVRGAVPVRLGAGRQRVPEGVRGGYVGDVGGRGRRGLAVHLHVLPQRAGVRVGLVAAAHLAVVRLVAGVDVRVLLPVAAVGEFPVAAVELALERLLPFGVNERQMRSVSSDRTHTHTRTHRRTRRENQLHTPASHHTTLNKDNSLISLIISPLPLH